MVPKITFYTMVSFILLVLLATGCGQVNTVDGIQVEAIEEYTPDPDCAAQVKDMRARKDPAASLAEVYKDLRVIDSHNHGAADDTQRVLTRQARYFIDRTVLFGNISEPRALDTDKIAYMVYARSPDQVYPFFAGISVYDRAGITMTVENLEKGYFGMGEIVGASTESPITSILAWKAEHPNDGYLPEIYKLSARYHAPVLLHIDPPGGEPILKLEQALVENPEAIIIFGHANAYNTPQNIERLISLHLNLYIDFFAGFTAYDPGSTYHLIDFTPLIEKYPDRFIVSTDSGYGIGPEQALQAIYEMLDLLTPETTCKVAYQNLERIIEIQPPTKTQIRQIQELSQQAGMRGLRKLNKRMANELIFELQKRLEK